ncbi:MAG TPA: sigma-70 family RNA polymerase sigma factor [Desulfotomaculum sp.]|nr:sigma-70 family RNA polymerase sigma factor [Desulfotomaculum sp.]
MLCELAGRKPQRYGRPGRRYFLAVLREIRSFKHHRGAAFSSWLFRIAYNKVVDYHRTRRQRDDLSIHDLPDIPDVSILPADDLDRRLLFKELYQMIQELPERQQEVVTMRFFAGMKNKEIAKALGISERSVASSLCRGLKTLHAKFSKGKQ